MKRSMFLFTATAMLMAACSGGDKTQDTTDAAKSAEPVAAIGPQPDAAALTNEAKAAVKALGGKLKAELQGSMKAGGPVATMVMCNSVAPEISQQVSKDKGMKVSRVSLKNRNPANAANEWQLQVLKEFESRKQAGESPSGLVYSEIVGNQFRFMKAIPTAPVCLKCHGEKLAPAVEAKLRELYPQDKATGYKEGDIRGAFVVVKDLK